MTNQNQSQLIGSRVRHYRQRLNMNQADLAGALGFNSAQIVSQIESGERDLKARELVKAAKVLVTSVPNLLSDLAPVVPALRWRDKPDIGFEEVEARLCLRCERYDLLESWCGERTYCPLPTAFLQAGRVPTKSQVQKVASDVRAAMQLGGRPASSLLDVLEENYGIRIFHDAFNGTALCVSSERGRAILLNRSNVRGRRNFSLAHELYHLLVEGVYPESAEQDEERHAQIFASALLLPTEALTDALDSKVVDGKINVRVLVSTAQEFHVSTEALLWKLCNIGRMSSESVKKILELQNLKSFEDRGVVAVTPSDLPDKYIRLAYAAYDSGRLGFIKLAEFLETSTNDLQANIGDWVTENTLDEEAELTPA